MKDERQKLEERLQKIKDLYLMSNEMIDQLACSFPGEMASVFTLLKDKIFGDEYLKEFINGIDHHRPPRIFLFGRTGVGKSSLINALTGRYVAKVSNTKSCTSQTASYQYKENGRVLMEILDTRGFAESETLNSKETAEKMLIDQIEKFSPDVVIFMLSCTHRDDIAKDVKFLESLAKRYYEINNTRLPIVTVVSQADRVPPEEDKEPSDYPKEKIDEIKEIVDNYKRVIEKNGLEIDEIIAVSSYIKWKGPDGKPISIKGIGQLYEFEIDNLEPYSNMSYHIKELYEILENVIVNNEAKAGMRMAARLDRVVKRLAKRLTWIFSGMSSTVGLSPIPLSDVYLLFAIQCVQVSLIAMLGGYEISYVSAKDFLVTFGGVFGTGFTCRIIAQRATKLLNIVPGVGSVLSAAIAGCGTKAIGTLATMYYIDGIDISKVKGKYKEYEADSKKLDTDTFEEGN